MRLIRYLRENRPQIGFLVGDRVVDLMDAYWTWGHRAGSFWEYLTAQPPTDVGDLLRDADIWAGVGELHDFIRGQRQLKAKEALGEIPTIALERITLLPPLRHPSKIICAGLNYPPPPSADTWTPPQYPVLFHKVATSLIGHRSPIVLPRISQRVEYEGELVVVISKGGKNIPQEESLEHIAGYTIANDVGAADIERRTSQWASGKMFDTFLPLGPALVTRDEIQAANSLMIKTTLNERTVQESTTAEMVFDVSYLISYISTLTTLKPGDLILTGSPKRVSERPDPRIPLQPGDRVSIEIEGLGTLSNPIAAEEG
jgi:2-keto-4-pentenoate hydratase/2-oxohepta-3-ene-1,7-dioic acid hydratase in catechol pathway